VTASSNTRRIWCAVAVALLGALGAVACSRAKADTRALRQMSVPAPRPSGAHEKLRTVAPLTPALRSKGYGECNPPDPLALGPYAPYARLSLGRILIPQKGGHTPDMGYDVLVHFHGAEAVRKLLVQVARGVVLVLVDKGVGGAGYARALGSPLAYPQLRRSIEGALVRHSGDKRAHIRRMAVSSWSAGTVAIGKLLQQRQPGIDAFVILDGLHGSWKQGARRVPDPDALDARFIQRELDLARRARRGKPTFVLTHTRVDPVKYPSTGVTASLLLRELRLKPTPLDPGRDPFGQISTLDVEGLHVWGFAGNKELAHCSQLFLMPRIVTELLEPAWGTPAMDRSVPPTPHPDWMRRKQGARKARKR
jgi:hypothetical protein